MKNFPVISFWFSILLVIINPQWLVAQKSEVEAISKLQKITVFTDRAMITKEASFNIKKGENIVQISGITPNLVDQSVQISLMEQKELTISEVSVQETFLKNTDQPEIQKLVLELNNLNNQINQGTSQISVINSENDFLKKVNPFPQNLKVSTIEMEAHTKFLEKSLTANFERIATIDTKLKKLGEAKAAVENELTNLRGGKNKSKLILVHLLSATDMNNARFSYSYISTEAGWSPQYEARSDFDSSTISFNYFATIRQSTGEEWSDANIEISTAKPFVYGNIPELSAWYIDVFTPRMFKSRSLVSMDQQNAPQVMMAQAAAPLAENLFKETEIQEESNSFTFVLPRKVNVASDGEPHRVSIIKSNIDAKFSWFTIPKLVSNVFLKASIRNPFLFPILTGPISVFNNQKLVGTAMVNTPVLANGEFELSLGIDDGIKIERKLLKKFTDYSGLINKETTVNFEYAIEITNGKSREITLDLNDQFPVSRNEKIKVEQQLPKGGDATVNEEGKISWKVTLTPGIKKTVPVKFTVSYPKEMNVSGL